MGKYWTMHIGEPVSIETAKLLGVAVTWVKSEFAFKFVPTEGGLKLLRRTKAPGCRWHPYKQSWFHKYYGHRPLHLITFTDEGGDNVGEK